MNLSFIKIPLVVCAIGVVLFACKKEDKTTTTPATTPTTKATGSSTTGSNTTLPGVDTDLIIDDLAIEGLFESSQAVSAEGSTDGTNLKKGLYYGCATRVFTVDTLTNTASFTYSFDGVTSCKDGFVRGGTFAVSVNGKLKDKGTKLIFTYTDFKITDSKGETFEANGIRTVENLSALDTINGIHQSIVVSGINGEEKAKIIKKDGSVILWWSNRTRKQTAGAETPTNISDDVLELTGKHGGVSAKGTDYSVDIKTALIGKECSSKPEIVAGFMEVTTDDVNYSLNFGDGDCDGVVSVSGSAKVTINGFPQTIQVPAQDVTMGN